MGSVGKFPHNAVVRRFFSSRIAWIGVIGIISLLLPALLAPLLANGRPLLMVDENGCWSMPFLRFIFAPESSEVLMEKLFNYLLLLSAALLTLCAVCRNRKWRLIVGAAAALLLMIPFFTVKPRMDKSDHRAVAAVAKFALFAPIPYGPDEVTGVPYSPPDTQHIFGCDDVGRDLAARLIYGARVSLSVGIFSTLLAMAIGLTVGMCTGYFKGTFDLVTMRLVEILLCFPSFLLLLILMSMAGDYRTARSDGGNLFIRLLVSLDSVTLVIFVLGLTGWIGLAFLVRGEVLKESSLPYIKSCVVSGVSVPKIMFKHLLPNIAAPVLISFTFGVAGAIIGESGLSFLGFGVQPPAASWGNLLRQAFDNPIYFTPAGEAMYWHLTLFPGLALSIAVLAFNFTGEALRRAFDVKER